MANLNKVLCMGNLTCHPETKYTPHGTTIAEFGIAVNRIWKDANGERQEEVTFVDIQAWGRVAEIAEQYLRKGSLVFIEGHLKLDTWTDKQSGQQRSKLRVIAGNLQLLGGKRNEDDDTTTPTLQCWPAASRCKRRPTLEFHSSDDFQENKYD